MNKNNEYIYIYNIYEISTIVLSKIVSIDIVALWVLPINNIQY